MGERPLTAQQLSDALGCFWNAAIGEARNQQDGMAFAAIMAEGMAAVQHRLSEIAGEQERAALASQAAEIERMMESLSEAIRLFKSKRLALNSQYEAIDVLREDGVYSIVIADLEEIRARAALDGEKP